MKRNLYWLLALFLCANFSTAQVISIGNGIEENDTPISLYYNYSYSQSIYLASEIGNSGNIYRIKYKGKQGLTINKSKDWVVYMGHTSNTAFTPNNWIPTSQMTEVYNGEVTVIDNNVEITLTTPFNYNGIDHLVIAVDENTSGYDGSQYEFFSSNVSEPRSVLFKNDNINPDPTNITVNTTQLNSIPNIDLDFNQVACNAPSNLSANNITTTTAELTWDTNSNNTNWNIEYGITGFTPGNGTLISSISNNPYQLSGLTPSTIYDFYIQSNCNNSESGWTGPYTFSTVCEPNSIPYYQGFENGFTHIEDITGCLEQQVSEGYSKWVAKNKVINPSPLHIPKTGNWNAYLNSTNKTWLFIPVELTAGVSYTFQMYARYSNQNNNASISIHYGENANSSSMANIIVDTTPLTHLDYQKLRGDFTPTTSGVYYVGIYGKAMSNTFGYLSIDDIKIIETPSCLEPDNLNSSNITPNSVTLNWTEEGNATSWKIEYGPQGFTPGNGTFITGINNTSYNVTGLSESSTYDFYVYSDCGNGDFSPMSGVHTITTDCSALTTYPFIENFENITSGHPSCWTIEGTTDQPNYHWYSYDNGYEGRGMRFDSFYNINGKTSELITPLFDLSNATDAELSFYFKNPNGGNFEVLISSDGGMNYTSLENNLINEPSWTQKTYDISNYVSSNVKIKFLATSNYASNDAYIYLDNFKIDGTLGVNDVNSSENTMSYYPNPVKDILTINSKENISNIVIINMSGQQIYLRDNLNATSVKVNMTNFENGVYLVKVDHDKKSETFKIIVQK